VPWRKTNLLISRRLMTCGVLHQFA